MILGCMAAATAAAQPELTLVHTATAGALSQVSVANLKNNWVVTAVRNGSGNLEVIVWHETSTALVRTSSKTAGAATAGAVAALD
jgi:hypothetical protein